MAAGLITIGTSHSLTVQQWNAQLFRLAQEKTFFGKFTGMGSSFPIQVKKDLAKAAGDSVTFGKSGSIRGTAGVTGNTPIEGSDGTNYVTNYEDLSFSNQRVSIDQIRKATKIDGVMTEKRIAFSMRNEAKSQLTDWMAYNQDEALFTAINGSDIVKKGIVNAGGKLTYDAIVNIKKEALFPTTANIAAGKTTLRLDPIRMDGGEEVFVMIVNPADAAEFRKSTDFKDFNKNGDVRGSQNAIFRGNLGVFNNVVLHEHSSVAVGKPVLLGVNACLLAFGQKEVFTGEEMFDYDNQSGFMIGTIRGVALARFDAEGAATGSGRSNGSFVADLSA